MTEGILFYIFVKYSPLHLLVQLHKHLYSLLLSDVYIKPQFRNKGYGIKLITEVIRKRWELDGNKNTVYLVAMYDKLMYFYGKIGFKPLNDTDGKFYGDMVLSIDEFKDYPK